MLSKLVSARYKILLKYQLAVFSYRNAKFFVILKIEMFCHLLSTRSSRLDVFCEKGVYRNLAKFTGKHLCQSLFFNTVAGGACNFIKKEALAQMFSCEFCEILRTPFFTEHLWWLLLQHFNCNILFWNF